MLRHIALAAALCALAACATQETQTAAASDASDCFRATDIAQRRAIDAQHFRLTTNQRRAYIVTVAANAHAVNSADPLVINTPDGRICVGNGLAVTLHAGAPPQTALLVQQIARAPDPAPAPPA